MEDTPSDWAVKGAPLLWATLDEIHQGRREQETGGGNRRIHLTRLLGNLTLQIGVRL